MKNSKVIALGLILTAIPLLQAADQAMDTQKTDTMGMDPSQPGVKKAAVKPTKRGHKAMYKCPMDGTMSSKPGKCTKCGAELVQVSPAPGTKKAPLENVVTKYRCPMDGTLSDKPGKCPKCGAEMMPENPATDTKS